MDSTMTLGRKIGMLAATLSALCLMLGGVTLLGLSRINRTVSRLTVEAVPGLECVGNIGAAVYRFRGDAWKHIASLSPDDTAEIEREMTSLKDEADKYCDRYERQIQNPADRANFTQFRDAFARYYQAWQNEVRPISHEHRTLEAYDIYLKTADAPFRELNDRLQTLTRWNADRGRMASAEATATAAWARLLTWLLLAGCAIAGGSLSVFILRGLLRVLRAAMSELGESANQIASAASQLASASQSLAEGASQQAASLEETSSSSEEIHSTARQNTETLNNAAALVADTQQKFAQATEALEQMVRAMAEINASSDKISRIIKVIDEIAFQTNILALNAAVEAARAGNSGMGFAVVAGEVRNLAQRSAQAAKDTAALIEESISKSGEGKLKVDTVAASIRTIAEEAGQVKVLMDQVKCASQEQGRGIALISKAILEMEQTTRRTAANGEESAAAAEQLSAQSDALKHIVFGLKCIVEGGQTADEELPSRAGFQFDRLQGQ